MVIDPVRARLLVSSHDSIAVKSPLNAAILSGTGADTLRIIVRGDLTMTDSKALASFASGYKHVEVCIARHSGVSNLAFLDDLPFLERFELMDFGFSAFSDLSRLPPGVTYIHLDDTETHKLSLSFLKKFKGLRVLFIEGHSKDVGVLSELSRLEDLTLRSITLPSLETLKPLRHLTSLDIKLGGSKNLDLLPELGPLRYLELWMIKGLTDLSPLEGVTTLQHIHLENLKNVSSLPSLKALAGLRRIQIQGLKGLNSLREVADAPVLEELIVLGMPQLEVSSFVPFKGHPALKAVDVGLGSTKKNTAIETLLGLPSVQTAFSFV